MTNSHQHPYHDHDYYVILFLLIFVFAIVEAVGSWYAGPLARLSDAGHMFTSVAALCLAWLAVVLAKKTNVKRRKSDSIYVELAVSIINKLTTFAVIFVVIEAISRFKQPYQVQSLGLTIIAILGLIVNLIVAKQLHHQAIHHAETPNNRVTFLYVIGSLLESVTAVAVVIYFTGWMSIDQILSLLISILLVVFTLNLIRDIWKTLHSKLGQAGQYPHDH